jgi:hypothetical protein
MITEGNEQSKAKPFLALPCSLTIELIFFLTLMKWLGFEEISR